MSDTYTSDSAQLDAPLEQESKKKLHVLVTSKTKKCGFLTKRVTYFYP